MNAHITYHVAQANQAKHGSLVDRGANGGLAGSDVRVFSISSRKCTVTGIDSHEIPGLDLVQCAALVQTNHGMVNLIMSEYAYYGRGHSIHSSGHIEWYTINVDDKSGQVGGQQRLVTIDGYSMPLISTGLLIYFEKASQQIRIYKHILLFISQVLMNEISAYRIMNVLKIMGSMIGPLIPTNTFSLIPVLMSLVIMLIDHCLFLTY